MSLLSNAEAPNTQGEERERWLDRIAGQVVRRGLGTPAILFLELHRPLSFLAGQATHVLSPFLAPLFGFEMIHRFAQLLEDPAGVDRLLERIERLAASEERHEPP